MVHPKVHIPTLCSEQRIESNMLRPIEHAGREVEQAGDGHHLGAVFLFNELRESLAVLC